MRILYSLQEARVVTDLQQVSLGFFDGLHRGHRAVIFPPDGLKDPKKCAVLTFQTHPMAVIHPEQAPALITGLPHKLKILKEWNVGTVILMPFNVDLSRRSAEDFLKEMGECLPHLNSLSVGADFRFGHQRKGDTALLKQWADEKEIKLRITPRVRDGEESISSSRIRKSILSGEIVEASRMLGRPFSLYGEVVHGDQRGRSLGFPTLNIQTEDGCHPPSGVYGGMTLLGSGEAWKSAINIGWRPTVSFSYSIEAHLLDFHEELYGKNVHIIPIKKVRDEKKFSSVDELKQAIRRDVEQIRKMKF